MSLPQALGNYSTSSGSTHSNIQIPISVVGNVGSRALVAVRGNGGVIPSGVIDNRNGAYVDDLPDTVASGAGVTLSLWGVPEATAFIAPRNDTVSAANNSSTITDASIISSDVGRYITGTGIPTNAYVGTVGSGTFTMVNASGATNPTTAVISSGTITLSDAVTVSFPSAMADAGAVAVELPGVPSTSPVQASIPVAVSQTTTNLSQNTPAAQYAADFVVAAVACGQVVTTVSAPLFQGFTTVGGVFGAGIAVMQNPTPGVVNTVLWKFSASVSAVAASAVYSAASDPTGVLGGVENLFIDGEAVPKPVYTFKSGVAA